MNNECLQKYEKLKSTLRKTGGCAIAYSGGVDSSLVLKVAHEVLGHRCVAVIATSSSYSKKEFSSAVQWVKSLQIPYRIIHSEELDIAEFKKNPPDRCYYCKKELFTKIKHVASEYGFEFVADGTNADDVKDWRPGMIAASELDVISPLREAGLTKEEIRWISREIYKLPMADKPAMACFASRFPYGSPITQEKLHQVEAVEEVLLRCGFKSIRARHHENILRLEVDLQSMERFMISKIRDDVVKIAKELGFTYVTLDLEGYRSGSMNETLNDLSDIGKRPKLK
jgi:uncharacterized protein